MKRNLCLTFIFALVLLVSLQPASAIEFGELSMGTDVDIHGYISQGVLRSSHNNFFAETEDGSSEFSEIAFNIGTDVSDKLHLGIQVLSRKLGEFGKGELEIDWGYADYRWKDWMGFRAGKMKLMHGLYNTTRDIDFLRTSIFLPQSVYNEAWRDTVSAVQGGEIYGDVYLGKGGSIAYRVQGGQNEFPVDSGVATTTEDQSRLLGIEYKAEDYVPKYASSGGFLWSTPVDGLKVGATSWLTKFKLEGDAYALMNMESVAKAGDLLGKVEVETRSVEWTGSIEYSIGKFLFAAEYSRNSYDFWSSGPGFEKIANVSPRVRNAAHTTLDTEGYYLAGAYRFTDWFEAGLYYSVYYADADDKDGDANEIGSSNPLDKDYNPRKANGYQDHDAWLKDLCLSLRFDITDNWVFKIEGHAMDGTAILTKDINSKTIYNAATKSSVKVLDTVDDWYLGAMKVTFNF